ncbi:MAG: glycogen debranching enzyme N-terminal domain-containing protein, partial [Planctomycetes bacterium]|nr:glycogen debranching enzyme N-terminal domain-containing protein [Planctomycetota bacterium]
MYRLGDGTEVVQEIVLCSGRRRLLCLRWKVASRDTQTVLRVRPFLSGRDIHALHRENDVFDFTPHHQTHGVSWRPYAATPVVSAFSDGAYRHDPQWYRNFCYREERERGHEYIEDLASPGEFVWQLHRTEAVLLLSAGTELNSCTLGKSTPKIYAARAIAAEKKRRAKAGSPLERAAEMYIVWRAGGKSIVAGYPWFTDWGRDTFIALRGLCLATGRLQDARDILVAWAGTVDRGMLPNLFP